MLPGMSKVISQQDGAPAHTAKAQEWCNNNLDEFWAKVTWPGNYPDLNPIGNLWSIVKMDMGLMSTPAKVSMLEKKQS